MRILLILIGLFVFAGCEEVSSKKPEDVSKRSVTLSIIAPASYQHAHDIESLPVGIICNIDSDGDRSGTCDFTFTEGDTVVLTSTWDLTNPCVVLTPSNSTSISLDTDVAEIQFIITEDMVLTIHNGTCE